MSEPRVEVVADGDELGSAGAALIADAFARTPRARIVAATGRSPIGLYGRLADLARSGSVDVRGVTAIQLDEYLGLADGDRRSLFGWMRASFLEPLGIADGQVVRLPLEGDLVEACRAFDDALAAGGGIDLAILGLGGNGHLGFNEPPSPADAPTREVALTPETIRANARYWGSERDVPVRAVTVGLHQLLGARRIVVVVSGSAKHEVVHRALEGPIGPEVPASFLRRTDADVTVLVDRAAWGEA
jgi:glucosamine-6-phosphate deaminase